MSLQVCVAFYKWPRNPPAGHPIVNMLITKYWLFFIFLASLGTFEVSTAKDRENFFVSCV